MIIFAVLAAGAIASVEPPPSQTAMLYRECVRKNADGMAAANESVEFTVKSAFLACQNERANYVMSVQYYQDRMGKISSEHKKQRAQRFVDMIEKPLEADVTTSLMRLRAGSRGNNAPNQ